MSEAANKEEALRCVSIAEKALQEGNVGKAEKFAQKAKQLCLCDEVRIFMKKLSNATSEGQQASASASSSSMPSTSEGVRQRTPNATSDTASTRPKATKEQEELVQRVLKSKDFYDTLGVSIGATQDEIKKAYRKLALKLHPDKNHAKGAEEAFKVLATAFDCLNNSEKKTRYDASGRENPTQAPPRAYTQQYYSADVDAEQIFNMFFGGDFGPPMNAQNHQRRFGLRRERHRYQPQENNAHNTQPGWATLIHILPVLFLFMATFMSGGQDQSPFSLNRNYLYKDQILTERGVPYFVHDVQNFVRQYPERSYQRHQIERQVDSSVRRHLQSECQEEKLRYRRIEMWKGKQEAQKMRLVSCDRYRELFETERKTIKSH